MKNEQLNNANAFAKELRKDYMVHSGENLSVTLEEAGIEPRVRKVLERREIRTMGDLSLFSEDELLHSRGMKPKYMGQIKKALSAFGLTLNIYLFELPPRDFAEIYPQIEDVKDTVMYGWLIKAVSSLGR
ncbi:MAG: hypothetical protein J6332_07835 [Abditibacteriota bacterium]|nr:hypothetical protein [Abditibacteriota bacterium]